MSIEDVTQTVTVGKRVKCDVCWEYTEDEVEDICCGHNQICKSCREMIPDELVDALRDADGRGEETWQQCAAREFIFSIRDSDESFDYQSRRPSDLKVGVWAVFGNFEEDREIVNLDELENLEGVARNYEFHYRDYPRYILGTLVDGKLRNFKGEWCLTEILGV